MDKEGRYSVIREDGRLKCLLCPVGCILKENQVGICMGRLNRDGKMVATNYGEVVSLTIDPIEKKPLYHFCPGTAILSTGPNGCNLSCKYCQNWNISQERINTRYISPERLASLGAEDGSIGVAYTYTEPLIWFEYLMDTMPLVRDKGGKNVIVTNGYINPQPLKDLLPFIDAMNVDLKSMDQEFYLHVCLGKLKDVQNTIKASYEYGVHIEITNLLIPGLNDTPEKIRELVDWVASISPEIPLHFSRYFPSYKMSNPETPVETMQSAYEIAKEKMDYVYTGNIHLENSSNTFCPQCGELLISRRGYYTDLVNIDGRKCAKCGREINIITA
jgi:pyruvate formate lyase activating enzyme